MKDETHIENAVRDLDAALKEANPSLDEKVDSLVYLVNALSQAVVLDMMGSSDSTVRSGGGALLAAIGVSMRMMYGKKAQQAFLDAWTGGQYSLIDSMKKSGIPSKDIEQYLKKGDKHEH